LSSDASAAKTALLNAHEGSAEGNFRGHHRSADQQTRKDWSPFSRVTVYVQSLCWRLPLNIASLALLVGRAVAGPIAPRPC
jgi:hypothetical protein